MGRIKRIPLNDDSKSYMANAILLSIFITKNALFTYIIAAIRKLPLIGGISFVIPPMVILILGLISYRRSLFKYARISDILIPLFLIIAVLITWLVYPQNMPYLLYNYPNYIAYCLPAFIIGLTSTRYDVRMFRFVSIVSTISIVMSYLYTFLYLSTITYDELGQSYAVLPGTLFVIGYYIYSKKNIFLISAIAGVVYAFMLGSRGPILLILVFTCLGILFINPSLSIKKAITVIVIFAAAYIFINSGAYVGVLLIARSLLAKYSISTRVIDFMISGRYVSYTSGRTDLYVKLLDILEEKPLLGYGLFGEWNYNGWNAHEIYLEVVFEYGWPLGVFMIIWYLVKVIPTFFLEKEGHNRVFILVFITFVLIQGVMSYSHLRPELFLLLGFCLKQRRVQRFIKMESDHEQKKKSLYYI